MPWYRKNPSGSGGNWVSIANVYRKNSDTAGGNWVKLRRIYRKNSDGAGGNWVIVHDSDSLKPYYTVAPTLQSNAYDPAIFFDGSTLTLTRGTWANVGSAYSPVSYSLKIQYSTDQTNWTNIATGTGTSLTYTISLSDVRTPSYYFRGQVVATNANGSTTYNTGSTRSSMDLSVTSMSASIVNNQIYAVWTYNKSNNSSNISSQQINVRTNVAYTYNGNYYSAYSVVHTFSVPPGTGSSLFGIAGTNIKPSTSIYVEVVGTANDSAGTQASNYSADFTSPILVGTVSISPSFTSPFRVESGTTVSAVPSGWPNGTTFTYEWYRTRAFQPADDIALGTGSSVSLTSSSSVTGERIYVNIYGTYDGQTSSVVFSDYYRIIPAPPSFTLGGGSSAITITSLAATGGEFYYGTYSGPTSGTIPQTAIGTDYSITGLSSGQYTVTLFSRAINGQPGYEVTTESNSSTSVIKSVTVLSAPAPTLATFSNGTFYIYFSGGSGPYYQVWYNTSTSPGVNNPTNQGVTGYDFNGTSSPIAWTPGTVSYGTTYNFWIRSSSSLTTTTAGEYSAWSTAYVQATPAIAAPTATSVSGSAGNLNVYFTGGTGPFYQVYWYPGDRADIQTVTTYDANGSSSPVNVTNLSSPTSGQTYYFWVRSVNSTTYTGTSSAAASPWSNSVTWTAPVQPPTNSSMPTLTPTSITVGTTLTAGVGTWNNNPTSYDLRIYRGTQNVATFETLVASTTSTSLNYTVTEADYNSGQRYFRTFVNASNSGGSSGLLAGQERGPITVSAPGTVTNFTASSLLSGSNLNWSASWSPPSNNGGLSISSYDVYVQRASSSSGPWSAATTQIPAGSGAYTSSSPYNTTSTSVSGRITGTTSTWVRVFVRANNSFGSGSYATAVG